MIEGDEKEVLAFATIIEKELQAQTLKKGMNGFAGMIAQAEEKITQRNEEPA